MIYHKSSVAGREERRTALSSVLPNLRMVENAGREQGLPIEDILDAIVACWSASRLAAGRGRRFARNCDSRLYGITDGDLGLADPLPLLCPTDNHCLSGNAREGGGLEIAAKILKQSR